MQLNNEQILELARRAYIKGGDDKVEGCHQWCDQGSREVVQEMMDDYLVEERESKLAELGITEQDIRETMPPSIPVT